MWLGVRRLSASFLIIALSCGVGKAEMGLVDQALDPGIPLQTEAFETPSAFPLEQMTSAPQPAGWPMDSFHKYLGYGTVLLAGVAAASGSDSALHHYAAVGAGTLALMTSAIGFSEYADMFEPDEGWTGPNLHIALGTLGAIGFAAEAIIAGSDRRHGLLGLGSTMAMGAAVVVILW